MQLIEYAFPNKHGASGMTLRDYFAAQALAGLLADNTARGAYKTAQLAYEYADAMLERRKK